MANCYRKGFYFSGAGDLSNLKLILCIWDKKLDSVIVTLPVTNMETQKGPCKDYSPFKGGLYGFPC